MGNYIVTDKRGKLSLSCPCGKCSFRGVSKLFDRYDNETKLSLLTRGKKGSEPAEKVYFTWDDWVYSTDRKYTALKHSMKICIVLYFVRFMHLENNLQIVNGKILNTLNLETN